MKMRAAIAVFGLCSIVGTAGCGWVSENAVVPEPTLRPGEAISADVAHVITESGAYPLPSGAFRLRLEAHGNIVYDVQTPNTHSSGSIVAGGLGNRTATLSLSGPGTAAFGIESGYVQLTLTAP